MSKLEKNQIQQFVHAGVIRRVLASAIDIIPIFFLVLLSALPYFLYRPNLPIHDPTPYLTILYYSLCFLYYLFFLASKKQATPGMMLMKIKLTDTQYEKPGLLKCFYMTLVMFLPFIASYTVAALEIFPVYNMKTDEYVSYILLIITTIMLAIHKKKQGYWDIIAGTYVVRTKCPKHVRS